MKNWAKPEVKNLGFENTYTGTDTDLLAAPEHYCHSIKGYHSTKDCTGDKHPFNNSQNCDHSDHPMWNDKWDSACCCYPGLS